MLKLKKPVNKGFTLIELVIAMAMMAIIGLSMANLNSTLMEQRESAKTKTFIQGVMNRFLTQLKAEFSFADSFTVTNSGTGTSILTLDMPASNGRPSSTVTYTFTNNTMVRSQSNTPSPDAPINFATITVLPNYMEATIRFTCGDQTTAPVTNCFERTIEPSRGEAVKIARVTVETLTPENRQTRITQAFGELGVTATDVYLFKPSGMVIP
ncbi:MAG: type II secretion system protein [Vampirovibrio sp.]|nr:type II secretion system protein [Vampirovibrio sp.]